MRILIAFTITFSVMVAMASLNNPRLGVVVPDREAAALFGGDKECTMWNTYTCNGTAKGCVATTCYIYNAGGTITNKINIGESPCGNAGTMCGEIVDALGNCKGKGSGITVTDPGTGTPEP